jgi:hypothetical protein
LFSDVSIPVKIIPFFFQDLKDLLEKRSGLNGRLVLAYFKENNELNEDMRDRLADVILNELLCDNYNLK